MNGHEAIVMTVFKADGEIISRERRTSGFSVSMPWLLNLEIRPNTLSIIPVCGRMEIESAEPPQEETKPLGRCMARHYTGTYCELDQAHSGQHAFQVRWENVDCLYVHKSGVQCKFLHGHTGPHERR